MSSSNATFQNSSDVERQLIEKEEAERKRLTTRCLCTTSGQQCLEKEIAARGGSQAPYVTAWIFLIYGEYSIILFLFNFQSVRYTFELMLSGYVVTSLFVIYIPFSQSIIIQLVHLCIFSLISLLAMYSLLATHFADPGYVPKDALPLEGEPWT